MFGNLKTKDFALEVTHLTDPDKLGALLALLAFAVALTVKTGVAMARLHPIVTGVCIVDDKGRIIREVKLWSEPEILLPLLTNGAAKNTL